MTAERLAQHMARIANVATKWTADTLDTVNCGVDQTEAKRRFIQEMRERVDYLAEEK